MPILNLKVGSAVQAEFKVVDVSQAKGFGLHVAGGYPVKGYYTVPEFFLRVEPAKRGREPHPDDRLVFVYLDGEQGELFLPLKPLDDPRPAVKPDVDLPEINIGRGPNTFEVDLGRRAEILSISVTLNRWRLRVECQRVTNEARKVWPRELSVLAEIPMDEGDLADFHNLWASDNGLLGSQLSSSGKGSGYLVVKPSLKGIDPGSEDNTLGTHVDDGGTGAGVLHIATFEGEGEGSEDVTLATHVDDGGTGGGTGGTPH